MAERSDKVRSRSDLAAGDGQGRWDFVGRHGPGGVVGAVIGAGLVAGGGTGVPISGTMVWPMDDGVLAGTCGVWAMGMVLLGTGVWAMGMVLLGTGAWAMGMVLLGTGAWAMGMVLLGTGVWAMGMVLLGTGAWAMGMVLLGTGAWAMGMVLFGTGVWAMGMVLFGTGVWAMGTVFEGGTASPWASASKAVTPSPQPKRRGLMPPLQPGASNSWVKSPLGAMTNEPLSRDRHA